MLPEPLVAADVDLRDFGFMPLDVRRLLTSETWIEGAETPKIAHAQMCLWAESWHQLPASSLPDNEKVLARLAMCDVKTWRRIRVAVLANWVKCCDGLLYHPVVAEKARESWEFKLKQRARTKAATDAREAKRLAQQHAHDVARNDERNEQRDVSRNVHQGTGQGPDQTIRASTETSERPVVSGGAAHLARALRSVGYPECSDAHPDLVNANAEGITGDELAAIALARPGKSIGYLVQAARGKRADAAERAATATGSRPAPVAPPDPAVLEAAREDRERDDKIRKAHNDFRLDLITADVRDRRIIEAGGVPPMAPATASQAAHA